MRVILLGKVVGWSAASVRENHVILEIVMTSWEPSFSGTTANSLSDA